MKRTFNLAKISQTRNGYGFVGSCSDDRVDLRTTRLDLAIFQDFINHSRLRGMPIVNVAHFQDGQIGVEEKMWIDGHYLKNSGVFDNSPLAQAAIQTLLEDRRLQQRRVQQSVGFYPRAVAYEDDVLTYVKGWKEHTALTTIPVNPRTDIEIVEMALPMTKFDDAVVIVGALLAKDLQVLDVKKRRIVMIAGRRMHLPDLPIGAKTDTVVEAICTQLAAPTPIIVFADNAIPQPSPKAPWCYTINGEVERWMATVGEVSLDEEPLVDLARAVAERQYGIAIPTDELVEMMNAKPTYAYLERLVGALKQSIPEELWRKAHTAARGYAGGVSYPRRETQVIADDYEMDPDGRLEGRFGDQRLAKVVRGFLAIYDANVKANIPTLQKVSNIIVALEDVKRKVVKDLSATTKSDVAEELSATLATMSQTIAVAKNEELAAMHDRLHAMFAYARVG